MSPSEILRVVEHRPWQLPSEPWVMMQIWSNLLFLHWPVPYTELRPLIPSPLQIDTFEGRSWIAITPFDLSLRARGLPSLPGMSRFPELNCRTYVAFKGRPGVYFFSLDAGSRVAVWAARRFYRLPYFYSKMRLKSDGPEFTYSCRRVESTARFNATYRAESGVRQARPGTFEHWLIERYCLYTHRQRTIYRADIHHRPWPLQDASCEIRENTIAKVAAIELPPERPILHFARELAVLIWRLKEAQATE
ncbi:MAG: DUF2071 domain-containing protein [Acidobacteria bacterium]|nr:DUF2071 domain-containing protein [Acidobacteriota bacterium]